MQKNKERSRYNIAVVGIDDKVFSILHESNHFNIQCVNLIPSFLTEKSYNPMDFLFKSIYTLRYKNTLRWFEIFLAIFYRRCYFLSSPFYRRYALYLLKLSESKLAILDFEKIKNTSHYLRQHVELTVISNWWLLPDEIIYAPAFQTVNLHPSALPKYRGSVPTLWALKNKDKETAVSFMLLDSRMDGGQIIAQHRVDIDLNENAITLENKCDQVIKNNLISDLLSYLNGKKKPFTQDESMASKTAKYYDYMAINLKNETGKDILDKIALYPHLWPLDICFLPIDGQNIGIKRIRQHHKIHPEVANNLKVPGDYCIRGRYFHMKARDSIMSCRLFKDISFKDSLYLWRNCHNNIRKELNMSSVQDIFVRDNLSERRKTIAEICQLSPMFDVIASKVNKRRLEDQNGHWLADFSTQSYLGFDFDDDVMNAAIQGIKEYGVVVAWCRLVATVDLFDQVEKAIAELVGSEASSIFASTTLLNHGVIPALAGNDGVIFLDKSAHATMYEGAKIARDSGAKLVSFPQDDFEALERLLIEHQHVTKRLIVTDGVYSMTGEYANLPEFDRLAKKYNALVFVDDAHGFGVVGENPSKEHPFGYKGNGLINYFGLGYDNMVYIGCFSKAYGAYGSFIACSQQMRDFLLSQATPHDLGGAGPAASMSAVLAGLKINLERGEAIRSRINSLTQITIKGLRNLGYQVNNDTGFPIISVWLGSSDHIIKISKILYKHHILLTLSPYPMVRKGDEALRITVTASNTKEEIDQLIEAFRVLKPYLQKEGYLFKEHSLIA